MKEHGDLVWIANPLRGFELSPIGAATPELPITICKPICGGFCFIYICHENTTTK